jgi:membrane protease YdiL (CAAX protease family)
MSMSASAATSPEVLTVRRREAVFAVGVFLLWPWLFHWLRLLLHLHRPHSYELVWLYFFASEIPRALAAAVLLTKWRWWRRTGWRTPKWGQMWVLCMPVAFVVYVWATVHPYLPGIVDTSLAVLFALAIGFTEEAWFRGLLVEGLRSRGAWQAVVISAAAFGAFHLTGSFRGFGTVLQALSAFGIGLIWGTARMRIDAIWPLVLLHAANDLPAFLPSRAPHPVGFDFEPIALRVGVVIVAGLVYAAVLTRPSKIESAQVAAQPSPSASP